MRHAVLSSLTYIAMSSSTFMNPKVAMKPDRACKPLSGILTYFPVQIMIGMCELLTRVSGKPIVSESFSNHCTVCQLLLGLHSALSFLQGLFSREGRVYD